MIRVLILLLLCFGSLQAEKYTLSVAAIFQNEAPYMQEWLEYHHSHGVEHFWLYNNNSTDNYSEILKSWIKADIVELIQWPSVQQENDWSNYSFTVQTGAYNNAIQRARKKSKWLALIDLDEFIVCSRLQNITDLLESEYSHVSGLCVNWQCYGTSKVDNLSLLSDGRLLPNLLWKMRWDDDWNKHSKSIVQPSHVEHCPNPHFCVYKPGHWAVDTHYNACPVCPQAVYIDKIRINHYWTRDEWFLHNIKIPRYQKWGGSVEQVLNHANNMNAEYDDIMIR